MAIFDSIGSNSSSGGLPGALVRLVLRFFQFILALTVAGLYGTDLHHAHQQNKYTDGKWVFAEIVAGLAAVTVLVYGVPFFKSYWAFGWDWVMFALWTALFGLFGRIYIPAHPTPKQGGIHRMKNAVWVDLVNMLLWLVTASYATVIFLRNRGSGRTLHTGRAKV
ncbi:hypothetical protein LTR78_003263 [Recurvomyces mirabilis]|uniref:MARVEL domain-containing protein n=1 Tax=Recurvomyces mirabilis TaxID=574656 RepID=A0AAE1C3T0_9PEZI|nr:hypothetical protein LTR78_003263 [Recurvomyces mirabilis]KAK5156919.1 hypothetical protein LTS14_004436 [Recurvomyces mirabilis]